MTLYEIKLLANEGDIVIHPDFQYRFHWIVTRDGFIDCGKNTIMRVPIERVFSDEWEIVDDLQGASND